MGTTDQAPRYREIERLGAGGMATVTLAEDTLLGREVALKRVYSTGDPQGSLRLKREALVGASLNHPNLVSVYDAETTDDGDVVIVMEYVEGETLSDVLRARGRMRPNEALRVLGGVAAALDAIHARGIVHRDVKPANILLGHEGAVKLADLGVADVADRTRITSSGAVVGSFSYMAPEQLEGGSPAPGMDVYALAAVAFEMLGGTKARPESNPLALAHAISTQAPPDLRDLWPQAPPAAAAVLQRGMSADPTDRPATPGELVGRLREALAPGATQPAPRARPASSGRARAVPAPSRSYLHRAKLALYPHRAELALSLRRADRLAGRPGSCRCYSCSPRWRSACCSRCCSRVADRATPPAARPSSTSPAPGLPPRRMRPARALLAALARAGQPRLRRALRRSRRRLRRARRPRRRRRRRRQQPLRLRAPAAVPAPARVPDPAPRHQPARCSRSTKPRRLIVTRTHGRSPARTSEASSAATRPSRSK